LRKLVALAHPVLGEHLRGAAVQVDAAVLAASGLGWSHQPGAVDDDHLLTDRQLRPLQVDVLPPQANRFAATEPG